MYIAENRGERVAIGLIWGGQCGGMLPLADKATRVRIHSQKACCNKSSLLCTASPGVSRDTRCHGSAALADRMPLASALEL